MSRWYEPGQDPESRLRALEEKLVVLETEISILKSQLKIN